MKFLHPDTGPHMPIFKKPRWPADRHRSQFACSDHQARLKQGRASLEELTQPSRLRCPFMSLRTGSIVSRASDHGVFRPRNTAQQFHTTPKLEQPHHQSDPTLTACSCRAAQLSLRLRAPAPVKSRAACDCEPQRRLCTAPGQNSAAAKG